MISLDTVKQRICTLYETNPHIHMNVHLASPKISLKNDPVTIKKVYPHIFLIEECHSGTPACHSLTYADIITGQIEIAELSGKRIS